MCVKRGKRVGGEVGPEGRKRREAHSAGKEK